MINATRPGSANLAETQHILDEQLIQDKLIKQEMTLIFLDKKVGHSFTGLEEAKRHSLGTEGVPCR